MTKGEVCSQELISSYKFYFQIASLSNALSCVTIDHTFFFSILKWRVLQIGNSGHLSICKKWNREITKEHRHLCLQSVMSYSSKHQLETMNYVCPGHTVYGALLREHYTLRTGNYMSLGLIPNKTVIQKKTHSLLKSF